MSIAIFHVDAFADQPFAGNPAGVCLLDGLRAAGWMQSLAAELNLSDTAFLWLRPDGDWDLRWFTPRVEVALCGHATLACAHVLWHERNHETRPLRFHTASGLLTANLGTDAIHLDLPADSPIAVSPVPDLAAALGRSPAWLGRQRSGYLAVFDEAQQVRDLTPNFAALAALDADSVIVTAPSDRGDHDFVSRFFAPRNGVPEDPVTGSAHCALGVYWAERLGQSRLMGYQVSRRGGVVGVEVMGDRVRLSGRAVTVSAGVLYV